jgi:hypothetical protein
MTIYAQLVGNTVVAIFSSPQEEKYWPGVIEVEDDDKRVVAFHDEIKSRMEKAREGGGE